jgi:hypothetical protein
VDKSRTVRMESTLHYLMRSASVVSSGTQKGPRPGFLIDVIRCPPPRYWLKHKRETGELFEALKDSCTRMVSSPEVVNRHFDVSRILETWKTSQEHDFALILHPLKIPLSDPGYVDRLPEMS